MNKYIVSMSIILAFFIITVFTHVQVKNLVDNGTKTTFMADMNNNRLSLSDMKLICGGSDDKFKCGPSQVLCGGGNMYDCIKRDLGEGTGYECATTYGRTRYLITGCNSGTYNNCAHIGDDIECGSEWRCQTMWHPEIYKYQCDVISRTYFYDKDCKAW